MGSVQGRASDRDINAVRRASNPTVRSGRPKTRELLDPREALAVQIFGLPPSEDCFDNLRGQIADAQQHPEILRVVAQLLAIDATGAGGCL
jgi:hypothetical protein